MKIDCFFIPDNAVSGISEDDYERVTDIITTLKAYARLSFQSIYVVDYFKKDFLYVSDNPLFLCGHQPSDLKKMGFDFYLKHVPQSEIDMLLEINRAGFDFYQRRTIDDRTKLYISYDFHIMESGRKKLINHKITPILLDPNGNVWLAVCVVSPSFNKQIGHLEAHKEKCVDYWVYSLKSHQWEQKSDVVLNETEKEILRLSTQGYCEKEIAEIMSLNLNTLKKHKKHINKTLGAYNISSAIVIAHQKKLM